MGTVPIDCLLDGWVHLDGENLAVRLGLGLRQLITSGLLAPGEQLPSERLLARSLHVSRPTVSAALDGLRSAGLLVSRQGSGTRVAETVADCALDDAPFVDRMLTGASLNVDDHRRSFPWRCYPERIPTVCHTRARPRSSAGMRSSRPDRGWASATDRAV
ncbi:MAG: winged helix-turn-helix domain-containing protein [Acidimicrobiales bacterium]